MPIEVRVPTLGESVTEAVIARWLKADGDTVEVDEILLELETEKASVEIPAEKAGVLKILKAEGATVQVGEVIGEIAEGAGKPKERKTAAPKATAPEGESRVPTSRRAWRVTKSIRRPPRRASSPRPFPLPGCPLTRKSAFR